MFFSVVLAFRNSDGAACLCSPVGVEQKNDDRLPSVVDRGHIRCSVGCPPKTRPRGGGVIRLVNLRGRSVTTSLGVVFDTMFNNLQIKVDLSLVDPPWYRS